MVRRFVAKADEGFARMRVMMIAVVVLMIASILSLVIINPSGEGQTANGGQLEASLGEPQTK